MYFTVTQVYVKSGKHLRSLALISLDYLLHLSYIRGSDEIKRLITAVNDNAWSLFYPVALLVKDLLSVGWAFDNVTTHPNVTTSAEAQLRPWCKTVWLKDDFHIVIPPSAADPL